MNSAQRHEGFGRVVVGSKLALHRNGRWQPVKVIALPEPGAARVVYEGYMGGMHMDFGHHSYSETVNIAELRPREGLKLHWHYRVVLMWTAVLLLVALCVMVAALVFLGREGHGPLSCLGGASMRLAAALALCFSDGSRGGPTIVGVGGGAVCTGSDVRRILWSHTSALPPGTISFLHFEAGAGTPLYRTSGYLGAGMSAASPNGRPEITLCSPRRRDGGGVA